MMPKKQLTTNWSMSMSNQIEEMMKECGFWDRYDMDNLSESAKESLAIMHHFCTDKKHLTPVSVSSKL